MPTHLYAVKARPKSTTRRNEQKNEEPQMTSRFGGSEMPNDRYSGNDTTIVAAKPTQSQELKINKSVGDLKLKSVVLQENSEYYKNKQKLKESIKGIKDRIGKITNSRPVSPCSSGSRVLCSDDSLYNQINNN